MKSLILIVALALPGLAESIPNPSGLGSLQASWSTAKDGSPLLSWIETEKDDSYTLKYAFGMGRNGRRHARLRRIASFFGSRRSCRR